MSTNLDYFTYILDLMRDIKGITYKKMMGEYLLYKDGILFGGVYDNRFLVKNTKSLKELNMKEEIPYPGAKAMLLIDTEDPNELEQIIVEICRDIEK